MTIDLKLLKEVELLEGGDVTRVGTGNRWNDVYAKLEPLGKTVVGGRNGDVGVGGFLLGGSSFSLIHFPTHKLTPLRRDLLRFPPLRLGL